MNYISVELIFKEADGRIKLFIILMRDQRYKDAQALAQDDITTKFSCSKCS